MRTLSRLPTARSPTTSSRRPRAAPRKSQPIGTVDVLKGTVTATHVDGTKVVLAHGDSVYLRDLVESEKGGSLGIVFADKTTFALGEEGRNAARRAGLQPDIQVRQHGLVGAEGAFVFVSGDIAATQSDAMTVRTPVGTIGIRGTAVGGNIASDGVASTITLLEDPRGLVSAVQITNAGGTQYLTHPNETVNIVSFFTAPSVPYISTALQNSNAFGLALLELPAMKLEAAHYRGAGRARGTARRGAGRTARRPISARSTAPWHVTLDSVFVSPLTGLAARLGISVVDLTNALSALQAGPPHPVVITIFTLGHDSFTHQDGFNNFNAFTVPNSLQSGRHRGRRLPRAQHADCAVHAADEHRSHAEHQEYRGDHPQSGGRVPTWSSMPAASSPRSTAPRSSSWAAPRSRSITRMI